MIKQRDYLFDNMKLLLIFLVVFAHLIEPYLSGSVWLNRLYLLIYTFHMPLFIFISGYFSKHDEHKKGKLIFYYFIPYIICSIHKVADDATNATKINLTRINKEENDIQINVCIYY